MNQLISCAVAALRIGSDKAARPIVRDDVWRQLADPGERLLCDECMYRRAWQRLGRFKGGRCWAQVPAKPQVRDGARVKNDERKVQYIAMLAWDTRTVADAFSDAVVAAVRALVPDAFEADGGVS